MLSNVIVMHQIILLCAATFFTLLGLKSSQCRSGGWYVQLTSFALTCHEGSGDETLKPSRTLQSLAWYNILCVPDFLFGLLWFQTADSSSQRLENRVKGLLVPPEGM